jgi:diguanylate cyclase (GGDEF)-like protein/putative nucleotidyltransferase with HDIG domain
VSRDLGIKVFISAFVIAALTCFVLAFAHWHSVSIVQFLCYLAVAVLASACKVTLPGINGTMSVSFLFIFLGIMELTYPETLLLGIAAVLVQSYWRTSKRLRFAHVAFNFSQVTVCASLAYGVFQILSSRFLRNQHILAVSAAAVIYFLCNTVAMAVVISLTEGKSARQVWKESYLWSFSYYMLGAAIAGLISFFNGQIGWPAALLVLPVIYVIHRSYRLYIGKLEDEKLHAQQMSNIHLRTVEALALAIEAKDHTTHDHLQRVRVYAMEVAKELVLSQDETEALRAASVLHDIGKLAIPEHIISKPGRLTPEEFEKMKIHPIIGAEILEQVHFPYPVVPIVRSHHEKWDGSGYPDGLRAEEIPIGARILSAVDYLDALASHRQYRPALPLDKAMAEVAAQSGKSFDPEVVQILQRRYVELEKLAHATDQTSSAKLSVNIKVERGAAPAAGFAKSSEAVREVATHYDYLASIAAARQEAQLIYELNHDLGTSLHLDDTLSLFSLRVRRLVPYDTMVVYVHNDGRLVPEYVTGDNFRLFSSLQIPRGEGLSGWVAQNNKPILNGNPSVEPGYLKDATKYTTLQSALAVPLQGAQGVVAVTALYRSRPDAFTRDELRILRTATSKLGLTIENALKYQQAESSATTDYLTSLPNARSLFLHLDEEISRCKRCDASLAVLLLDLDGFKLVNDRFGHLEGNNLLRMFAVAVKDACRKYDYAARIGGDEFVIVAPGLGPDRISEMTGRLQQMATEVGRAICGEAVLSVSIGTAVYPTDGGDAEELLSAADQSMEAVKNLQRSNHSRGATTIP